MHCPDDLVTSLPSYIFPETDIFSISYNNKGGVTFSLGNPSNIFGNPDHRKKYQICMPQPLSLSIAKWLLVLKRQLDRCCIGIELFQVVKIPLLRKKNMYNYITWNKYIAVYKHIINGCFACRIMTIYALNTLNCTHSNSHNPYCKCVSYYKNLVLYNVTEILLKCVRICKLNNNV